MNGRRPRSRSLTAITPVLIGQETLLREALEALPTGAGSPLARVGGVHLGRWVVIDQLPYEGPPQPRDALSSAYLFFSADFDGSPRELVERIRTRMRAEADEIWGMCTAYPGSREPAAFADYLMRHRVRAGFSVIGYPRATVQEVDLALDLRRRLRHFAALAQEMDAGALHAAWRRFTAAPGATAANRSGA